MTKQQRIIKEINILYIGDFIKKNGPSMVDINLSFELEKLINIEREQVNKKISLRFIKNIMKSDIINVSGVSAKGLLSLLLSKLLRKKSTFLMHGLLKKEKEFREFAKYRIIIEYLQVKLSNKIICVSKILLDLAIKNYKINNLKVCFIHNGIFLNAKNNQNYQKDKYQIVTVGGGRKEKGIIFVCDAIKELNMKDVKLIVLGEDGLDTDEIKKYDFVTYLGFLPHKKLLKYLEKSNIFIQNSEYESFGLSALEAIKYKCNVIISNKSGVLEVLRIDKKYIVNFNDVNYLSKIIEELINKNCQKIEIFAHSWDKVAKQYIKVWKELL